MHALTLGPHRGADWLSRSAIGGREARIACESYVVRAIEPSALPGHGRALWLRLRLAGDGTACCEVATFGQKPAEAKLAQERWPAERALLDPERGGLGIGECQLSTESSQGLVRGGDFAVGWRFRFAGGTGQQSLLGRDGLYLPGQLSHKAALLALGAHITQGELEIWHSLGRFAQVTRIPLDGWHLSAWHLWGRTAPQAHAIVDIPDLPGGFGSLGAISFASRGWWRDYRPQLGAWQEGQQLRPFVARAGLRRPRGDLPAAPPGSFAVALRGAAGELNGTVTVPPGSLRRLEGTAGGADSLQLSAEAHFAGTFQPRKGQPRQLSAERVFFEGNAP